MRLISLDIGFDREALPKSGNRPLDGSAHDCAGLRLGFTYPDENGNPVALAGRLYVSYGMLLTLYDLTGGDPVDVTHLSLVLRFQKARKQDFASPVAYAGELAPVDSPILDFPSYEIYQANSYPEGHSTVFDGCYPIWNVHPPTSPPDAYPYNQLQPGKMAPRRSFDILSRGRFYYTVELRVGVGDEPPMIFRIDPEMVVDNNGGPDAGGSGDGSSTGEPSGY